MTPPGSWPPRARHGSLLRPGDKPLKVFRRKVYENLPRSFRSLHPEVHTWAWEWAWVCRLECPAKERSGWSDCCRFHAIVKGERHLWAFHFDLVEAIIYRRPLLERALSAITVSIVGTLRCD